MNRLTAEERGRVFRARERATLEPTSRHNAMSDQPFGPSSTYLGRRLAALGTTLIALAAGSAYHWVAFHLPTSLADALLPRL